jgi:Ca2+-binding RTX toxin-like protein
LVIFVDGNNTFNGNSGDTGNDTIVAGSGFDTINTGTGATTVNSGTGSATITLNDTGSAGFNDHVWLDDGHAIVNADGTGDGIVATTAGQTIVGGINAASNLAVVLLPNSDASTVAGSANGNDLVTAGAGTTTVYDDSNNNSVVAGSGNLYFLGGAGISADLTTGAGNVYAFDGVNSALTVTGAGAGTVYFVAGSGNVSLDGAGSSSTMYIVGGDTSASDSLVGGSGHDVFTAGGGSETLTGGTGTNIYQINDTFSAGASLTVTDFLSGTANNLVLDGFSQQDVNTLLSGGTESGGNYTVTIGSGTTITFDGVTSGSQLAGHIITFGNT